MKLTRQSGQHLGLSDNNDGLIQSFWVSEGIAQFTTSPIGKTQCCGSTTMAGHPFFREEWVLQVIKEIKTSVILFVGYDRNSTFGDLCIQRFCTKMNKQLEGVCRFTSHTLASKEHLILIETLDRQKFYDWQYS